LVNATSQCAHASGCTEGDESDDESILNQVLTFFTVLQILELHIELEQKVFEIASYAPPKKPARRNRRDARLFDIPAHLFCNKLEQVEIA
jgi:hypothetical protein